MLSKQLLDQEPEPLVRKKLGAKFSLGVLGRAGMEMK